MGAVTPTDSVWPERSFSASYAYRKTASGPGEVVAYYETGIDGWSSRSRLNALHDHPARGRCGTSRPEALYEATRRPDRRIIG
jgi:hypothetical protein